MVSKITPCLKRQGVSVPDKNKKGKEVILRWEESAPCLSRLNRKRDREDKKKPGRWNEIDES
jgi:hypothetical protein